MQQNNIELKETRNGFSLRDLHSKAILNKDQDSLIKYKIQRNKMARLSANSNEIQSVREEVESLKDEIREMKNLLLQITAGSKWQ